MRDVELASNQIAQRFANEEYSIPPSRLSDIETKGIIPNIFRLYSFAAIYRREYRELLSFYGLELDGISTDVGFAQPQKSHLSEASSNITQVRIPTKLDPGFSLQKTTDMKRAIQQWGTVPMAYLELFADDRYSYGYIGSEDFTMHPILPPGSFVQVDQARNKVEEGTWRSEFERPIYFVNCATDLPVAGVRKKANPLSCNLTLCRPPPCECLNTRRRPRSLGRWWGWRCASEVGNTWTLKQRRQCAQH